MGRYRTPKPGEVWRCEEGAAVVLDPAKPDRLAAARELLIYHAGSAPEQSVARVAAALKVDTWRSTTKAWREDEGVDDSGMDWFAPHGDGARSCLIGWYPHDDLHDLTKEQTP